MSDDPIKIQTSVAAVSDSFALAEEIAMLALPTLEEQYGPLYPVTNQDGTVDIYDDGGEIVASIDQDGEIVILCEEEIEAEPAELCDPYSHSCPDLPEEDLYSYDDPWLDQDDAEALQNSAKIFSDSPKDVFSEEAGEPEPPPSEPLISLDDPEPCAEEPVLLAADEVEDPASAQEATSEKQEAKAASAVAEEPAEFLRGISDSGIILPLAQKDLPPVVSILEAAGSEIGELARRAVSELKSELGLAPAADDGGLRGSVRRAVESAVSSLGRCFERAEEKAGPPVAVLVSQLSSWLRDIFSGHSGPYLLASAEFGLDASVALNKSEEGGGGRRASDARTDVSSQSGRASGHVGNAFSAGGAAMQDANNDPFAIAMSQADKGGPPYFFAAISYSQAAPGGEKSPHERVTAAGSQGDAQHHHGEQEGDGRGKEEFTSFEEDLKEELEDPAPVFT